VSQHSAQPTPAPDDKPHSLWWARGLLLVAGAAVVGLSVALGLANESVLFALGLAALAGLSLVRPELGALALIALSSADLIGTAEVGRFTVRASQLVAAAASAGLVVQLVRRGVVRETVRRLPTALWFFIAFSLVGALRLLAFGAPNPIKGYAYSAWSLFVAVAVAGSLALILDRREKVARALQVLIAALTAISLFGLVQWGVGVAGFEPPLVAQWMGGLPRINGLSYEPSYFAFSTVLGLALLLALLLGKSPVVPAQIAAACAGVQVIALTLSSSRSGWIALLILTAGFWITALRRRAWLRREQRRGLWIVAGGYLLAILLVSVVLPEVYARMARKGLDLREQSSSAPRLEGVKRALVMFRDRPIIGVGLAQFGGTLDAADRRERDERQVDALVTFNLYAELLAETGLVGFALAIAGLLLVARGAWRARRSKEPFVQTCASALLVSGLLVFGIMYQFNQTLFRTDVWCLLGLVLAVERLDRQGEEVRADG